jgi:integrase
MTSGAALEVMLSRPDLVAQALMVPGRPIAESTGRGRLVALRRFVRFLAPLVECDAVTLLDTLDRLLPANRPAGWHTTGIVLAGSRTRRRRGPTLEAEHLHALVRAAGTSEEGRHAVRDRAIVALHCWSGLRPEEIVALRWEALSVGRTSRDELRYAVTIYRDGQDITMPMSEPAIDPLESLAIEHGGWIGLLSGYVFQPHRREDRPLSYRAAREVLRAACSSAGLPAVDAVLLRAAFAAWLKSRGLSDHEVALMLGLRRVRSVDRLLLRHAQLSAQRRVREILA